MSARVVRLSAFALALVSLLAPTAPLLAAEVVHIGTAEKAAKGAARDFGPVTQFLTKASKNGRQYVVDISSSPEKLYADLRDGKLDAAFLGPVLYVRAHHEFGATPVVADGPKYSSSIIVRADSPVHSLEELAGKSFAFGYAESTSSHLFPLLLLSKAHVKESELGRHEFVGGHEQVIDAVLSGRFEAGGVITAAFESNKGKGLRALATSDPIPGVPLVVRKDADKGLVAELRAALLSYKAPAGDPGAPFARGAVAATDTDYNQIRFLCKIVLGQNYK